ncbi:recombinase family protein [Pseudotamlana agarivorans]|uniref:recombinase family protein n=1 Tax=Pseudotamlana agarivorans TaxID=481183 RepID=UPI00082DC93C|nr:recombinase family protein [Tamlana agarivorans]
MLAIYTRLSKEDEQSNSIYNQLREGKEFATNNGYNDYKLYDEGEGVSGGASIKDRPQLHKLISDIESKLITTVWFRDQNRLERRGFTFHYFVDIVRNFNINVYVNNRLADYNDPDSFLQYSISSAINENKILKQSQQTKKALHGNLKEGKTRGGIMSYGYTKDTNKYVIIDENEAKTVKRIYKLSLEGKGTNKIAEILNNEGVPTRYNKMEGTITLTHKDTKKKTTVNKKNVKWAGNTIRNIIKSEVYKGVKYLGKGKERKQYEYPIIIEPYLWQQVNDHLPTNRNNSGKVVDYRYLLKGLIRCGKCGRNYAGRSRAPKKGKNYRTDHAYKCSSSRKGYVTCGNRGVNITKLESFILKHLFTSKDLHNKLIEQLKTNDAVKVLNNQLERFQDDLKALQIKEDRLYKLMVNSVLNDDERIINDYNTTKGKVQSLKNRIAKIKNKIEIEERTDRLQDLDKTINDFSLENNFSVIQKHVHDLIENIEILYTRENGEKVKGFYVLRIDYKGLDSYSLFSTNMHQNKWIWSSFYRKEATNESELKQDIDLTIELTGRNPTDSDLVEKYGEFKGLETLEGIGSNSIIELTDEDLVEFN